MFTSAVAARALTTSPLSAERTAMQSGCRCCSDFCQIFYFFLLVAHPTPRLPCTDCPCLLSASTGGSIYAEDCLSVQFLNVSVSGGTASDGAGSMALINVTSAHLEQTTLVAGRSYQRSTWAGY